MNDPSTELVHTEDCGQVSINISKPGITKGQHWHNSKWELFIVVAGHGLIQERNINTGKMVEFEVSGGKIEAIHMIPGWTHNIINLSDTDYDNRAAMFGMDADPFMAAKGHNGFRNSELVKKLCANLGVMYMCAFSKEEYNRQKEQWLCKHKSPVLLEVFTNDKEESQALLMMNSLAKNTGIKAELRKTLVYKFAKRLFRR